MAFEEMLQKVDLTAIPPIHNDGPGVKPLEIVCGPMVRYWGMADSKDGNSLWRGSIAYVTRDSKSNYDEFPEFVVNETLQEPYQYANRHGFSFWRYDIECIMDEESTREISYVLKGQHQPYSFFIPGRAQTMRTMFYSCNGFSLAVDTSQFPGSLWDDVINKHAENPFHVMLGGGDQLYCDSAKTILPKHLLEPYKRLGKYKTESEQETIMTLINNYYIKAYLNWFGKGEWTGLNGSTKQANWVTALATIPTLNIWDDHDIIDGFGSYPGLLHRDYWWVTIGTVAYENYMLFQQCVSPQNDPKLKDPAWSSTGKPGPYIHQPARSLYARLGKSAAFFGLDCRTERTRHIVCAQSSYDAMFNKLKSELTSAKGEIKHLYLMLGVPIAYPRMVWAENIMGSWVITPITWLSKHKIAFKAFVNDFDGEVELLDDLNDHWCANHHKKERNEFLYRLNKLSTQCKVRVTILTGDVHLAAVGRFRSPLKKKISPLNDPWYMVCPVSSAITNTPPPPLLADFMNKRNKVHHLGKDADEDMIPLFGTDVDGSARNNNCTLPRRNYCILDPTPNVNVNDKTHPGPDFAPKSHRETSPHEEIPYVSNTVRITIQAESDQKSHHTTTKTYEVFVPPLEL